MLTHHNWWSTHYECYAALCQKWGYSAGSTAILTNREVRDPLRKKTALSGGKTEKNLSQFFLRLANTYKKYILQKNWVKTVIPALSSGRSNLQRPIWGCHRQLDDRDHLVGQLTRRWVDQNIKWPGLTIFSTAAKVFSSDRWKLHPDWVYCEYNYAGSNDRQFDTPENNMRHFLDRLSHEGVKFNWGSSRCSGERIGSFSNFCCQGSSASHLRRQRWWLHCWLS